MVKEIKKIEEFKEILKSNAAVVIDFFAEWCGPCKMLAPQVEKAAESVSDTMFVKVNVDDFSELAQDYEILSLPTLIFVKDGVVVDRNVGFVDSDFVVNWVKKHK